MLNKSVLLNLRIAKSDMSTFLGLSIVFLVLMLIGMRSMFLMPTFVVLIALVCYIVFYIRIVNKVFFTSFFDDEGTMYMTLPIPAKDVVMGKVLAVSCYITLIYLLLMVGLYAELILTQGNHYDLLTSLTGDMTLIEGSPAELAMVFGLFPISTFASSLFNSSFILAIFLKMGMKKQKLLTSWIVYGVVRTVLSSILEQVGKLFGEMAFGSAIETLLSTAVYLAAAWFFMQYCIRQLEEKYSV